MATIKDLSRQLQQLKKQIPFAMAQAMTSTVRQIEQAEKTAIQRKLNATPFTVNSVKSKGATKNNLVAKVFVQDKIAEYLDPFETGGMHKLQHKAKLVPHGIRLNKYGNIPRNKLEQLKAKPDVFIGRAKVKGGGDGIDGVWQRKKPRNKRKSRRARSPNGTRQPRLKTRPPKLLIGFGDALPVQAELGYISRAEMMAKNILPKELSKAIANALRTAK
ncbi:hypothetical protein RZP29_12855 [Klebsiella quasipneumoniae subsp. similipneumoniae]|uniref:Uncharacterized protein n=1 Tax=Klebsiella quasipneumoniae subsp. similipneumoniae TaxID=1463164 RepID=A0AAE4MR58_9ENTR|nr:hypothetical protein [Klebsiella quasipneumoniae]MBE8939754.1 hypothetical protein [Escherichia coli]MDV0611479.1 hypothetical protein [Klebsiella quasipneumoniae subsp. similipneumoniae]MDV0641052.1 hypothetical protein [Klebsiella quasipneumoniae subsp. similipneumoniae]MDV0728230.1 hypothetical protein [Klebsiella quasipneumoniae subsp. similipneumoniae]MDV0737863.1 hypothetical protein [Klebsiella quasipneumoniae subsp. similipneumoniae]